MRRLTALLIVALVLVWTPSESRAHPHAWIDIRSTVVFDEAGRVVAVELDWLFDPFYTVFILEDIAANGDPAEDALMELARANLRNLAEVDYFLEVRAVGLKQGLGAVESFETGVIDDRLRLAFRVPLADPIDPRTEEMTYAAYDPTYYVEILHVEDDPITLEGAPLGACSARIEEANPDAETVTLAAMLARDESGPDGLGRLFAETVHVACQ